MSLIKKGTGQWCAAGAGPVVRLPCLHDGVDLRIDRLHGLACGCFQFGGGHLASGHQLREPDRIAPTRRGR
ncbi:hypothetical protein GCM10010449_15070 [Streptomyces rectiviolaceus]|uniref:Uncharacterized protein n=1 Tax=Streptomyces rectiviolaceus TaxID=332591 RepID=A0ABP6M9W1_9ACTN